MNAKLKAGTLDLILLAVLESQALYGLEILKEVNTRTQGSFDFKEGSLYPALHRLVKAGWVHSHWQDSTVGGAPRKYYELTDKGAKALLEKKAEWSRFSSALDALVKLGLTQEGWIYGFTS